MENKVIFLSKDDRNCPILTSVITNIHIAKFDNTI